MTTIKEHYEAVDPDGGITVTYSQGGMPFKAKETVDYISDFSVLNVEMVKDV